MMDPLDILLSPEGSFSEEFPQEQEIIDITNMSKVELRKLLYNGRECTFCCDGLQYERTARTARGKVRHTVWTECPHCEGTGIG